MVWKGVSSYTPSHPARRIGHALVSLPEKPSRPYLACAAGVLALVFVSSCGSTTSIDETSGPEAGRWTFTRDIAPVIYSNCAGCHRPGEAGPFPLLTYDDVRRRAQIIQTVTQTRYMPPWLPEPGHGEFEGVRRLTDAQITMIEEWVAAGAPEGNPADLPALPVWTKGCMLYRGRIDNRYVTFGKVRPRATQNDLEEVLDMVVAGQPVDPRVTKPIGCYISDMQL